MITVSLGTAAPATAVTSLAPSLAMPRCSYSRPTINPVTFCKKISGIRRWQATSTKCAALRALSEKRTPLLAMIPTGCPCRRAKPQTMVVP